MVNSRPPSGSQGRPSTRAGIFPPRGPVSDGLAPRAGGPRRSVRQVLVPVGLALALLALSVLAWMAVADVMAADIGT
jgi:hypothetical protein